MGHSSREVDSDRTTATLKTCYEDDATVSTAPNPNILDCAHSSNDSIYSGAVKRRVKPKERRRRPIVMYKKPTVPPHLSADASRIRSRYLHRLGLETPEERQPSIRSNLRRDHEDPLSIEVLKDDYGTYDETIDVGSPPVHSPMFEGKRQVSFESSVVVHEIPSRKAYSERVRKALWMLRQEFEETVTKNSIEFMSEGCDPAKVLEEEDFILHEGQLVHPVYLMLGYPEMMERREKAVAGSPPPPTTSS